MYVFTSFGFRTPIVREKLKGVLAVKEKTVLIVPFAGFNPASCAANEKSGLIEFGFSPDNVFVCCDASSFGRTYDYIYVPGGETFKLLYTMQRLDLMRCVRQAVYNGSVYIGVSAGAELAATDLAYVRFLEDDNYSITAFAGLGLAEELILPHADQRRLSESVYYAMRGERNARLLQIANDGVVIYTPGEGMADIQFI